MFLGYTLPKANITSEMILSQMERRLPSTLVQIVRGKVMVYGCRSKWELQKKVARTLREVHQLESYESTKRACTDEGLNITGNLRSCKFFTIFLGARPLLKWTLFLTQKNSQVIKGDWKLITTSYDGGTEPPYGMGVVHHRHKMIYVFDFGAWDP